jgi:hypothetical protein
VVIVSLCFVVPVSGYTLGIAFSVCVGKAWLLSDNTLLGANECFVLCENLRHDKQRAVISLGECRNCGVPWESL